VKKILYIDMDDVLCDFTKAYKEDILKNPEIKYPQSQYGFFRNLEPIKDGIDTVKYLKSTEVFSVYILTAPSIMNPLCYTEKRLWIEDYLGFEMLARLIISPNKGLNKGDYLIDDNVNGKGQEEFEGELIHFGSKKFENWKSVERYFKEKYKLK